MAPVAMMLPEVIMRGQVRRVMWKVEPGLDWKGAEFESGAGGHGGTEADF